MTMTRLVNPTVLDGDRVTDFADLVEATTDVYPGKYAPTGKEINACRTRDAFRQKYGVLVYLGMSISHWLGSVKRTFVGDQKLFKS